MSLASMFAPDLVRNKSILNQWTDPQRSLAYNSDSKMPVLKIRLTNSQYAIRRVAESINRTSYPTDRLLEIIHISFSLLALAALARIICKKGDCQMLSWIMQSFRQFSQKAREKLAMRI